MHPIERLRAVARARDVDQRLLAREAAVVLGALADDPLGLVTSCRRLLDRHPGAGVLWWACARLLDSADPRSEARAVGHQLADDPTVRTLGLDIPERATAVVIPDPAGGSELADRLTHERHDLVVVDADDPSLDIEVAVDASRAGEELASPMVVVVEAGAAGPRGLLATAGAAEGIAAARAAGVSVWGAVGRGRRLPGPLFDALVRRSPGCEVVASGDVDRLVEPRQDPCPCPAELVRP